jgi:cytochrome c peroxidase
MSTLHATGHRRTIRRGAIASMIAASALVGCRSPCEILPELDAEACVTLRALELPAELPPARGNAVGDDPRAVALGFAIFYDARFSSNQGVRCATCHLPERSFQDGRPTAIGLAPLTRKTPSLLNTARLVWQFWDGRADSAWSQALGPLESPREMDFTRLEIAHRVAQSYRKGYEDLFGPLPPLDDAARFPPRGAPGDPAFDGMAQADRDAVDRIAANVGKSLDAYERKLAAGRAPLDAFLAGDPSALDAAERRGLVVFFRAGCVACHAGPTLSDDAFHDLGLPTPAGAADDRGREAGLALLAADRFNAQGPHWDGPRPAPPPAPTAADRGAFRTPSLRNVALAAPYGHDGRFATLRDAVDFHLRGGGLGDARVVGAVDVRLQPHALSAADEDDLLRFLDALTGQYPPLPYSTWPDR